MEVKTEVAATATEPQTNRGEGRQKLFVAALCVLLSAIAVAPFYFMGRAADGSRSWRLQMPITHDMHLHYEQMKSFYAGLAAGSVYPRWEEDTNRGFGAATTSYYPPGIYYLTSAFYALSHNWIVALFGAHLLMMIAAAAALYLYVRQFLSRRGALVAMSAYIFLPYHLLDQYQRGAMAELLGFIWMPLMLFFGERLFLRRYSSADRRRRPPLANLAGLAATYGAFLWSHPPTAYQFSLAFGIYTLLLSTMRRDWRGLLLTGAAILLGVLTAAAYLYPAAAEQNLIHHEYVSDTWPYHSTYIFVHHLPYSAVGAFFRLLDGIWIFGAVVIPLTGVGVLALGRRALRRVVLEQSFLWLIIGVFATFMMLKISEPFGRLIPRIDIGVFTWRMFSITTLVMALLTGVCAHLMAKRVETRASNRAIFTSFVGLTVVGGIVFSVATVLFPMIHAPVFEPADEHINYATIPHTAPPDPFELPWLERAMLAQGNGEVFIEDWRPEARRLRLDLTAEDVLIVRTFNFPGWTATVNGEAAEIVSGTQFAEITLDLPAGAHVVDVRLLDTPVRRRAEQVSLLAFALLGGLLALAFIQQRRRPRQAAPPPPPEAAQQSV